MFSENQKISERQIFRLLTFDLLGLSTLLIPSVLAQTAGRDGVFAIVLGTLFGGLFLKVLSCVMEDMGGNDFAGYLEQKCGGVFGRIIQMGYFIYLLLLAGYTAYLFTAVILRHLLREETFYLVLFVIVLLTAYGLISGIEGRARIYELLFWFLLIPLFLMIVCTWDEVDVDYWTPIVTTEWSGLLMGSYAFFSCLALLFLVLFLMPYGRNKEQILSGGKLSLLFVAGIHLILYLVLLGIFGGNALAGMEDAVITLMSTVKVSGGFLKRTDAIMFGIWFFTLYALLGSTVFYSGKILTRVAGGKKSVWAYAVVLIVVCLLAVSFYKNGRMEPWYLQFLCYVGTPFLVLVPLLLLGCKKRIGKKTAMLFLLCCLPFLSGCCTAELEDKNFPLEAAVTDATNAGVTWMENTEGKNRVIDYSHLKLLVVNQSVIEGEKGWKELLSFLENQNEVPRNTYVAVAEDAEKIMEENEEGESAGTYFEELFENVSEAKKQVYPTLGMLYEEQENKMETLYVPYVAREEDSFFVKRYYVVRRGVPVGICESEAARLSFFAQNKMRMYTLSLDPGFGVELSEAQNRIAFSGTREEKVIELYVRCKGKVVAQPAGKFYSKRELERMCETYLNQITQEMIQREKPVDITNSYKKIGAEKREWYDWVTMYETQYEHGTKVVCHVEITWVNL